MLFLAADFIRMVEVWGRIIIGEKFMGDRRTLVANKLGGTRSSLDFLLILLQLLDLLQF